MTNIRITAFLLVALIQAQYGALGFVAHIPSPIATHGGIKKRPTNTQVCLLRNDGIMRTGFRTCRGGFVDNRRMSTRRKAMEEMEFAGATSFYVLRHGETDANAAGIIQGSSDYSRLTDTGRSQALAFGMMALDPSTIKRIDQIFVSPLTRAQDTLKLIRESAPPGILPPSEIILPNLREIDMYSWENQKKDTLKQMYPNEFAAWRSADPDKVIVDGRLPLHETWSRAGEVWKEIRLQVSQSLLASTNDNVSNGSCTTVGEGSAKLLVCHGTLGQALLGSAFGMDATTFRRNVFPNCGMAEIVWHHNEDVAASWRWHNICDDGSDKTEEWRLGV